IRLIGDGDIAGVIHTTNPDETGIDIYLGIGGAPEGVLAAAALACMGGQMQARLDLRNQQHREKAARIGFDDPRKKFDLSGMVSGDVVFAATGITDGNFLSGVKFTNSMIQTETVVMRSSTGTVRSIRARHGRNEKFHGD
ncbi:MAG: fructose-bisphosphatase class II, partial [Hyphomicrobiales bacterium]|nr:fructose-bisphosphatase class II [Hyphomicrobiales bacterium]